MKHWFLVLIAVSSSSCEETQAVRLQVDLSDEIAIPDDVDELRVTIKAEKGAFVCRGETQSFDLTSVELPLYVLLTKGTEFDESVAYWISGYRDGEKSLRNRVGWSEWPDEGVRDIYLKLEAGCLMEDTESDCGEEEHCIDVNCLDNNLPYHPYRTGSTFVDVSCWAAVPAHDDCSTPEIDEDGDGLTGLDDPDCYPCAAADTCEPCLDIESCGFCWNGFSGECHEGDQDGAYDQDCERWSFESGIDDTPCSFDE